MDAGAGSWQGEIGVVAIPLDDEGNWLEPEYQVQVHGTDTGLVELELVVVMLVLGILAAIAMPKFVDIRDDAHTAKNSGTGGAFGAAVSIVHAQWLSSGASASTAPDRR